MKTQCSQKKKPRNQCTNQTKKQINPKTCPAPLEALTDGALDFLNTLLGGSDGKQSSRNGGDLGVTFGSGRSPGEGNVYILLYSCLENSLDRGAWWAIVHGVTKSQT